MHRRQRLPLCDLHEIGDPLCHYPRPQATYLPARAARDPLHLADIFGGLLFVVAVIAYFVITGG